MEPIKFNALLKSTIWGGEKEVAEAGKYLLADVTVGEDGAGEG